MKTASKKFLPGLLLLLFIYNTVGYSVYLYISRYYIQCEMQALTLQLKNENSLEQVIVRDNEKADAQVCDNGRELRIKDKLFDIVKRKHVLDYEIFYCLPDEKENIVYQRLTLLEEEKSPVSSKPIQKNEIKATDDFTDHALIFNFVFVQRPATEAWPIFIKHNSISSAYIEAATPPPKTAIV